MGHSGSHLKADLSLEYHHFLDMLKEWADRPYLYHDTEGLKVAIEKYSLMMDLQIDEAASPDVLWVWYLHLLHPERYYTDCNQAFGELVPFREVFENTCDKFDAGKKKYLEQLKARSYARHSAHQQNFTPSVNLLQSALRMVDFVVDGRRVWERVLALDREKKQDLEFFDAISEKYLKFLRLAKKYPDAPLMPTFDISLAWHAHLRFPIYYRKDCVKLFGHVLDHGDEYLDADFSETARLWEIEFHEKYELLADIFPPDPPKLSKKKQQKLEEEERQRAEQIIQSQLELIEKRIQKEKEEQEELKKQEAERLKFEAENAERIRREIEEIDTNFELAPSSESDDSSPPKRANGEHTDPAKPTTSKLIEKDDSPQKDKPGKPKAPKETSPKQLKRSQPTETGESNPNSSAPATRKKKAKESTVPQSEDNPKPKQSAKKDKEEEATTPLEGAPTSHKKTGDSSTKRNSSKRQEAQALTSSPPSGRKKKQEAAADGGEESSSESQERPPPTSHKKRKVKSK